MLHLYKEVFVDLAPAWENRDISLDAITRWDLGKFQLSPKHFCHLVARHFTEAFPDARADDIEPFYRASLDRFLYLLSDYYPDRDCYRNPDLLAPFEMPERMGIYGEIKNELSFEIQLANYLAGGDEKGLFIRRFEVLTRSNLSMTLQEVRREVLCRAKDRKDLGEFYLDPHSHQLDRFFSHYDEKSILREFDRVCNRYHKGYGKDCLAVKNTHHYLQAFLRMCLTAVKDQSYESLLKEDIEREHSLLFAHGAFIERVNPYLIDHIYSVAGTKRVTHLTTQSLAVALSL